MACHFEFDPQYIECSLFKSPQYLQTWTGNLLNMEGVVYKTTNSQSKGMLNYITLITVEICCTITLCQLYVKNQVTEIQRGVVVLIYLAIP